MQISETDEGKPLIELEPREINVLLCAMYTLRDKVDQIDEPMVSMSLDLHNLGPGFDYSTGPKEGAYPTVSFNQEDRERMEDILSQYFLHMNE